MVGAVVRTRPADLSARICVRPCFAADYPRRREGRVRSSTMATLSANAIVPGMLDR
jgi:hypothetical protein